MYVCISMYTEQCSLRYVLALSSVRLAAENFRRAKVHFISEKSIFASHKTFFTYITQIEILGILQGTSM